MYVAYTKLNCKQNCTKTTYLHKCLKEKTITSFGEYFNTSNFKDKEVLERKPNGIKYTTDPN